MARPTLSDIKLIDQIGELKAVSFSGTVYRLVRDGRDPLTCWHPKGRWDDGHFDVLYTSLTKDGAIAEVNYHLSQQPFRPDFLTYRLYELSVSEMAILDITDASLLTTLGVDLVAWGRSDYVSLKDEYLRTQEIAAIAEFHEHEGLKVPSARSAANNLVILTPKAVEKHVSKIKDLGPVDWGKLET